jgi:hypothetical protein
MGLRGLLQGQVYLLLSKMLGTVLLADCLPGLELLTPRPSILRLV